METNEERDEERVSLCQCALVALQQLNLASRLPLIQELLVREKAVTLSQVKLTRTSSVVCFCEGTNNFKDERYDD